MTNDNLLVFKIFLFVFLYITLEVDNMEIVSQKLIVYHYDWTKKQVIRMNSSNKKVECKPVFRSGY